MQNALVKRPIVHGTKERTMKFIALGPRGLIIGHFLLNQSRQWSFSYAEDFKKSNFSPLNAFPLLDKTYGHDSCVKFLSERIKVTGGVTKGFSFASAISEESANKNHPIEIHVLN